MSKAAKQSILILIILLLAVFAFASITVLQKQQLLQTNVSLQKQIAEFQKREKQQIVDYQKLQEKLKGAEAAKAELEDRLNTIGVDIGSIDATIEKLTQERDEWKQKVDVLQGEREQILAKLRKKEEEGPEVVYKYIERGTGEEAAAESRGPQEAQAKAPETPPVQEDTYWAQVLKEKAALELELDKLKGSLTDNSVEVVELKKKNSDLQLELSRMVNEKETIEREIKYANDLADSLALELARAKNDKKFLTDRVAKFNKENSNLRDQIKRLTSTKIALEKTIIRIQDEKKDVEKKLLQTENVIQSRIDEIWEIKDSLSRSLPPAKAAKAQEVELPPIVVSADQQSTEPEAEQTKLQAVGFNGNIVSVNEENNFVIVDIGEDAGVRLGETLNVYRGSEFIAGLEVIQTRKDISAADIKNKVAKIQIGDVVR